MNERGYGCNEHHRVHRVLLNNFFKIKLFSPFVSSTIFCIIMSSNKIISKPRIIVSINEEDVACCNPSCSFTYLVGDFKSSISIEITCFFCVPNKLHLFRIIQLEILISARLHQRHSFLCPDKISLFCT